ncbi:MAG: hypothetical protein C4339_00430 [Nitrososphaerota archaeon]
MRSQGWISLGHKLTAALRLARPINSFMIGAGVLIGYLMASRGALGPALHYTAGFLTGFFISSFSMAVNDIHDLAVDMLNRRERPLVLGSLSRRSALGAALIFLGLGLFFSAVTGPATLAYASAYAALGYAYSVLLKRWGIVGNIAVAASVAAPFPYGALIKGGGLDGFLALATATAFASALGREVLKGIPDIEGDKASGIRTIAVKYGPPTASLVAALALLMAAVFSVLPFLLGLVGWLYLVTVLPSCLLHSRLSLKLFRGITGNEAIRAKNTLLIYMGLGLVAFIVGGLTR